MLPNPSVLANDILGLSPTTDATAGMGALTGVIGDFMNQVQGGSLGTPGIFTLGQSAMASALAALPPVADSSWISPFADAVEAGVLAGMITPATVTNPVWIGSGTKDVSTLSSPAATISTISAAKAVLVAALASVTASNNPPMPLAQAMADYTLAFIFTCIGLGSPPGLTPIPIPTPAE